MEFPKWLVPFRDNLEFRKSFNNWIDEKLNIYKTVALEGATNMADLKGLRYAAGELLALKQVLIDYDADIEREQERINNEIS